MDVQVRMLGTGARKVVAFTRAADNNLVQPGASAWGTDWIGETKVPLPLGAASAKDQCERIGHLVAFGNT